MTIKLAKYLLIQKGGEIIPYVKGISPSNKGKFVEITIPDTCECCGAKLVLTDTELYCPNNDCSKTRLHRIEKWVKKVDIYEIGESTIKALFDSKIIQYPSDLYTMKETDVSPITGGARSAEKIVKSINSKKEIPLDTFVGGLDIDGWGETLTGTIMNAGFDTLEKIQKASVSDLEAIKGIGGITAKILKEGLKANDAEIKNLFKVGITIKAPVAPIVGGKLDSLSFCFTGALNTMKRDGAEALVRSLGGSVKSVSKGLTYLVTNDPDSGSSKNIKAQSLGIKLIDEKTFIAMTK
jgi:DNA ligase (NAD+)